MMKKTIQKAFITSLPVMAGYIVLGIAFGILLKEKGFSIVWAFMMSLTIYAGSMEFVAIHLLDAGASLVSAAMMTLLVNARHLIYSLSMLERYQDTRPFKPYLIFGLTDETYALVCNGAPEDVDEKAYYFFLTLFDQCYWLTGSVLGAFLGSFIPFDTTGIDFSMTALFITIFVDQILKADSCIPGVIGIGCSVLSLCIFGASRFLIPAMIGIIGLLILVERKGDD